MTEGKLTVYEYLLLWYYAEVACWEQASKMFYLWLKWRRIFYRVYYRLAQEKIDEERG